MLKLEPLINGQNVSQHVSENLMAVTAQPVQVSLV